MSDPARRTTFGCCAFSFGAVAPTLARARRRLRRCLGEAQWPAAQAEHVVIAVNEALSNAVQHAYDPADGGHETVEMAVMIETTAPRADRAAVRRVRVVVTDGGRWRAHPRDLTQLMARPVGGFALMRALTSRVVVDLQPTGTRVELVSEPVPALDAVR